MIKAINTEYNGYKFRSRLEARWAVFFDSLGIEYEYEPEGIELGNGEFYLPDFYLPDFNCYFEVKRKAIRNTEEGQIAISKISYGAHTDSWSGIICFGDPIDDDLLIYCQELNEESGGTYEGQITIGLHPRTYEPYLFSYNDYKDRTFCTNFELEHIIPMVTEEYGAYKYDDFVNKNVIKARINARQARFEHGETPNIR